MGGILMGLKASLACLKAFHRENEFNFRGLKVQIGCCFIYSILAFASWETASL